MTDTVGTNTIGYRTDGGWTIDDLDKFPDDGMRYEIADGCLLVSPAPFTRHVYVVARLRGVLHDQAPPELAVAGDGGVGGGNKYNYFIPDLFVLPWTQIMTHPKYLLPANVRLVVEVLSEYNRSRDTVLKRHHYASAGIPLYWIVDPMEHTLTVRALRDGTYQEEATVKAGTRWSTEVPFPLELDPGDFCA